MGFEMRRTFVLEFAGTDLDGAEVKLRSASIATIQELRECDIPRECEILAEHLVSWDLEMDGEPIPPTKDGVMSLEVPAKNLILVEWIKATRGITAPLDHRSSDGGKPGAEQIPMESL